MLKKKESNILSLLLSVWLSAKSLKKVQTGFGEFFWFSWTWIEGKAINFGWSSSAQSEASKFILYLVFFIAILISDHE